MPRTPGASGAPRTQRRIREILLSVLCGRVASTRNRCSATLRKTTARSNNHWDIPSRQRQALGRNGTPLPQRNFVWLSALTQPGSPQWVIPTHSAGACEVRQVPNSIVDRAFPATRIEHYVPVAFAGATGCLRGSENRNVRPCSIQVSDDRIFSETFDSRPCRGSFAFAGNALSLSICVALPNPRLDGTPCWLSTCGNSTRPRTSVDGVPVLSAGYSSDTRASSRIWWE